MKSLDILVNMLDNGQGSFLSALPCFFDIWVCYVGRDRASLRRIFYRMEMIMCLVLDS